MDIEVIANEQHEIIKEKMAMIKNELLIISPFLSYETCLFIKDIIDRNDIVCQIITKFDSDDFRANVNSLLGQKILVESGVTIFSLSNLHAKLYIFDRESAIITSANFTKKGLENNFELGILVSNRNYILNKCIDYYNELKNIIIEYRKIYPDCGYVTLDLINEELIAQREDGDGIGKDRIKIPKRDKGAKLIKKVIRKKLPKFDDIQVKEGITYLELEDFINNLQNEYNKETSKSFHPEFINLISKIKSALILSDNNYIPFDLFSSIVQWVYTRKNGPYGKMIMFSIKLSKYLLGYIPQQIITNDDKEIRLWRTRDHNGNFIDKLTKSDKEYIVKEHINNIMM